MKSLLAELNMRYFNSANRYICFYVTKQIYVTIQNWRIDYHVSFPYLRAKLKT